MTFLSLYDEIKKNKRIYLPAGNLQFNWISVDDIAEFTVKYISFIV